MFGCTNWGTDNCHEEVAKWKSLPKNVGEGESFPIWPPTLGEEQKKLDDICRTCPYFKT